LDKILIFRIGAENTEGLHKTRLIYKVKMNLD
jgi:hypothetical protein